MLFNKDPSKIGLKWRLIGLAGKIFIDFLFLASKIEIRGRKKIEGLISSRRYIFAFWHGRILLISYAHKGWDAAILVSDSADGEIIAQILQRQGQTMARGSTGKGGVRAVAKILREMRVNKRGVGVVPDGPRGPRYKVQPGVVYLSQKSGYPIIPVTYSAKWCIIFNSWDRFMMPLPGSRCILIYGDPIAAPPNAKADQIKRCIGMLEDELMRITVEADACFGRSIS